MLVRGTRAVATVVAVGCVGLLLGHIARWFADGLAVNLQLYFHAFRFAVVRSPWVVAPLRFLSAGLLQYSALGCWAIAWGRLIQARPAPVRHLMALAVGIVLGVVCTMTPVRISQPQLFATTFWHTVNPLLPAGAGVLLAAAVGRRAVWGMPATILFTVTAIGVSWWCVPDVSYAVAYGCVPMTPLARAVCPPVHMGWGLAAVTIMVIPVIPMMWRPKSLGPYH
jgi:hypothetical protein